ncbi:MAG TPA: hypothetical protein VN019_02860 [Oxalicibacterium sp.]|nr:hypothetical protein [Oxalicibacterium sp.]
MDKSITPRALDIVLSVRVAEALRDAAIAKISAEIPNLRQGDDHRRADVLTAAITTLRLLDVEAVLGDLRAQPVPGETEAFERVAKMNAFNVQQFDGDYFHPITRRVHAVWRAATRWQQLHDATQHPVRRAEDQQGE